MSKIKILILCLFLNLYGMEQPIFLGKEGAVYNIVEKDMYLELKKKFETFQKDGNISQKLEVALKKQLNINLGIENCEVNREYKKNFIYVVKKDIIFKGVTLFKKGYKLNILEKKPLDGFILYANYSSKKEKQIVMDIISTTNDTIRIYLTKGNMLQLKDDLASKFPSKSNIIIGKAPKILLKKMNIQCVPTFAYQDNNNSMIFNQVGVNNETK